jgi:predicted phage tail protein
MKIVEVNLHGPIGKKLGKDSWSICVDSVSESMHAINRMTGGKLFMLLAKAQKKNQKYKILINDEPWKADSDIRLDKVYDNDQKKSAKQHSLIKNSELTIKNPKLKKIDIVPVVEGADEIFTIIIAIILIIIGIMIFKDSPLLGAALIAAGIGLLAAGISALLMEPPMMDELRTIQGATSSSYLFNGPVNISREGGPVPVCYGELLVGSQTLSAYYDVDQVIAAENQVTN